MTAINRAIANAFEKAKSRNWDKIYWAIDLHETCLVSSYGQGNYKWINRAAVEGLNAIGQREDSQIIIWSAVHAEEEEAIMDFFREAVQLAHPIYFNHNPEVENTATGNFDTKFYFNVLLDDKAGFDYETDWDIIIAALEQHPILELPKNQDFPLDLPRCGIDGRLHKPM